MKIQDFEKRLIQDFEKRLSRLYIPQTVYPHVHFKQTKKPTVIAGKKQFYDQIVVFIDLSDGFKNKRILTINAPHSYIKDWTINLCTDIDVWTQPAVEWFASVLEMVSDFLRELNLREKTKKGGKNDTRAE